MPQVQPPLHSVTDFKPGNHACCIYDTDEEHRNIITPFLRRGLEQNEKVVYIADARDPRTIINYLKTDGVDVEHYQKKGQFNILLITDVYLKGGVFDPDWMMSILLSDTQEALAEGYTALRVTTEMSWALRGLPGSERLMEYENKLDNYSKGSEFLSVCQYDRRCFSNGQFHDVLAVHPFAVIGTSVYDNFYYVPPKERAKENPSGKQLNSWISNLMNYNNAEEALRESEAKFRLIADNTADSIWIFDMDMHLQYISPSVEKMKGFTVEEVLSQSLEEMMTPESLESLMKRFHHEMALEASGTADPDRTVSFETEEYCKTGTTVLVENSVTLLRDAQGRPVRMLGISRDITGRKRMEDALRKERDFAESVVGTAQAIIMVLDTKGHIVYLNPYMEEISGYILEEVKGKDWFEMFLPSHIQESTRSLFLKAVCETQTSGNVDTIITKDGRERLIEWYDKTLKNADGSIKGLLAIGQDVTDQKHMEEALRKSEEKYRGLIEQTGEGVWIIDRDYRTTFANNRLAAMLGYTPQEMIGKQIREFMPAGDMEIHIRRIRERLEGKGDRFEQKFFRKDGSALWAITSVTPLAEEKGLVGAFAMLTDITDRKRAEEALHESEERYRILTDAAHDAIYTLSPEGVVTYVNSAGSALTGMPPEKIVGLSLESLYHPDIAQELRANLDKVISTKRPVRFDAKFWHENPGQITWLDAQLVPQFGPDGSVVQVMGISRSITDRKHAEMLLKRFNEELESKVRLRTSELEYNNALLENEVIQRTRAEESVRKSLNERELLLREIHHRVRNNFQIILSLISLQSRNIKDQKILETIGEFQNRIVAMAHVHDKMYSADDISSIDLSEICTFLGMNLFKSYKVDPQQIRFNIEMKDLLITIESAIPLSLIINELILNSIKHAFPQGATGEIIIAGRREADSLVLSFKDTGIGIPEDLDWMRSYQSLGLRLVVNLVEQLDGTIELDRTTGTAFTIVVKEK
ncbi:MAG: PAS domain S-box protein [Methanoregula sp.]|nr:PAS domain S-box protein [Methanoregula sp.]